MKKLLSSILLVTCLTMFTVPVTGCSAASTENDINTILTEAQTVITQVDPSAPWLPQFSAAVDEVKRAEATWVAGGAKQDVINALNILAQVTALIPVTAPYADLIAVLVAGIDIVLNLFGAAPSPAVGVTANPYKGRVVIHHKLFGDRSKEFVKAWNAAAIKDGFKGAVVQ